MVKFKTNEIKVEFSFRFKWVVGGGGGGGRIDFKVSKPSIGIIALKSTEKNNGEI